MTTRPAEIVIAPNKGPQTQYVASSADVTVMGGAAGGGKTYGTLFRTALHADKYKGYFGGVFRREMPMVLAGGGLWEESMGLFPIWGAKPNLTTRDWRFPNRSLIQFRSLQHAKDVIDYQGAQFAEFVLEEGTHFEESQFWYLFSRLRTTCGMKARCAITCNPDPDSWVRKLIDWYIGPDGFVMPERAGIKRWFLRDGDTLVWGGSAAEVAELAPHIQSVPRSLRFIPSMLSDNPQGDPTYRDRLMALPLIERERLLGGNWNVRAAAGLVFKREWFDIIDRVPSDVLRTMRVWDRAATPVTPQSPDPDWTRGVKISKHASGLFVVRDVVSLRGRPHEVDQLIMHTAQVDGPTVEVGFWQDPGAAGKAEAERHVKMLAGRIVHVEKASLDKETYARATSSQAEAGNVKLVRGEWNDAYLSEHQAFPDGKHDDIIDAESLGMLKLTADTWQAPVRGMVRGLRG